MTLGDRLEAAFASGTLDGQFIADVRALEAALAKAAMALVMCGKVIAHRPCVKEALADPLVKAALEEGKYVD